LNKNRFVVYELLARYLPKYMSLDPDFSGVFCSSIVSFLNCVSWTFICLFLYVILVIVGRGSFDLRLLIAARFNIYVFKHFSYVENMLFLKK